MVYTRLDKEKIMGYVINAEWVDENTETLKEALGPGALVDELSKYFSMDEWADALKSIAGDWDIELI